MCANQCYFTIWQTKPLLFPLNLNFSIFNKDVVCSLSLSVWKHQKFGSGVLISAVYAVKVLRNFHVTVIFPPDVLFFLLMQSETKWCRHCIVCKMLSF